MTPRTVRKRGRYGAGFFGMRRWGIAILAPKGLSMETHWSKSHWQGEFDAGRTIHAYMVPPYDVTMFCSELAKAMRQHPEVRVWKGSAWDTPAPDGSTAVYNVRLIPGGRVEELFETRCEDAS